jgi:hypothetical protein
MAKGTKPISELKSPWAIHVANWRAANPGVPYRLALVQAKATYAKPAKPVKVAKPAKIVKAVSAPRAVSPWIQNVKEYRAAHAGMSYKDAMMNAREARVGGSRQVEMKAPEVRAEIELPEEIDDEPEPELRHEIVKVAQPERKEAKIPEQKLEKKEARPVVAVVPEIVRKIELMQPMRRMKGRLGLGRKWQQGMGTSGLCQEACCA